LSLSALFLGPVAAAGVQLNDEYIDLVAGMQVLEDPRGDLRIEDLLSKRNARAFAPAPGGSPSFGFSASAWWVRLEISNPSAQDARPVLRQSYPLLDVMDVWVVEGARVRQHWRTGDRLPWSSRPIAHRDFLFPLAIDAGKMIEVYLRAESQGPVNLPLGLYSPERLLSAVATEQLALGALFGSILLLASGVLVLFLFVRDRSFLYYLLYVLSYGSYMAIFDGIAQQHLLPNRPEVVAVLQVMLLMSALYFLLLFASCILQTARVSPALHGVGRGLRWLIVAIGLVSPFFTYAFLVQPMSVVTIASTLLVMVMGVRSLLAGQPTAGYFLLAWSAFLIGVLAYMLKSFGLLPHNALTQYGFQIGTVFEFALLSLALAARVQEIKQQSQTDALTGLGNRAAFDDAMALHFQQCRSAATPLTLLIVDVDHFKTVNDTYGHAIGDRVLQRIANVLRRAPPQAALAFRYGGEEFAVLLPRHALDTAEHIAQRVREEIATDTREPRVTVSVGLACSIERRCEAPRDLFRAADEALYRAKRQGRNRVIADSLAERRVAPSPS